MAEHPCPFCEITQDSSNPRRLAANEYDFVIADGYPVTDGHTLIIAKRHVASFFELSEQEHKPAGYNIGINDGAAAGQTVPHCHLHLIPRYEEEGSLTVGDTIGRKYQYCSNALWPVRRWCGIVGGPEVNELDPVK